MTPPGAPTPRCCARSCAATRRVRGQRRYMAVVEDRSVEEERDLAQIQIGALIDTAGVGIATFQESSGWVRQRAGGAAASAGAAAAALQSIGRDVVAPESMPEFERLQPALRQASAPRCAMRSAIAELGERWLLTRVEPATLASGKRTTSVVTLDVTEQQPRSSAASSCCTSWRRSSRAALPASPTCAATCWCAATGASRRCSGSKPAASPAAACSSCSARSCSPAQLARRDRRGARRRRRSSRPSSSLPAVPRAIRPRAGTRWRCDAVRSAARCARGDRGAVGRHAAEAAAARARERWRATAS